jgi:2-phospho-L-lactate guanylyltransferase
MDEKPVNALSGIHALLPIKDLSGVKTRLGDILSPGERRLLVRAMAEDVVSALKGTRGLAGIHVISHDVRVTAWAKSQGLALIDDTHAPGLSAAIALAGRQMAERGARAILVVLADTPLSTAPDFEAMIAASNASGEATHMILAPSRDGDGSNGLLLQPPGAMTFHYGSGSAEAHSDEAAAAGLAVTHVTRAGLAHDVDTEEDLRDLIHETDYLPKGHGGHSRTGEFLTSSGIAARMAQNEGQT